MLEELSATASLVSLVFKSVKRLKKEPSMQLSASFVGRRGDRVELSLILSAEQETLVESVSVDDCGLVDDAGRVVDALTKPIVLHAVGTVVRVVDLGYKRREIKAAPVELKLTAVLRKELRIITVRVQTDKGEAVARSAI